VVDILWGHDDIGTATTTSQAAAERLRARVADAGRSDSIRVHPFSTNSHAKIVVADNGKDRWQALLAPAIGSRRASAASKLRRGRSGDAPGGTKKAAGRQPREPPC
jgi:hypothetical protein